MYLITNIFYLLFYKLYLRDSQKRLRPFFLPLFLYFHLWYTRLPLFPCLLPKLLELSNIFCFISTRSPAYEPHHWANKLIWWFRHQFQHLYYDNLPYKHSKGNKVTRTWLRDLLYLLMIGAWQRKKHAFLTYFVIKSSRKTSNTNTRVLFSFPVNVLVNSLSTVNIMCTDTVTLLSCQRRILLRDWFVWQCFRRKIAMDKHQSARTQLQCRKWFI